MLKRVLIGIGLVAALAAVVFFSLRQGDGKKGVEVYAEEVVRRDIARVVKASGQIDPRVKVNLSAHVIGKIERLYVAEGDEVEAGSPFLELEKEAFVAARDQSAAQLAISRSRLRQAEIDLQNVELKLRRMQRLYGEQIASVEQLEAAQLEEKSAQLRLEQARESVLQAEATLEKAKDDLSKTTIYAPIAGRVVELHAEEGEVVVSGTMNNPASVIGVIADLSEILAEVDVDETEVAYLAKGQGVELSVDALPERTFGGRLVEIGSSGFSRQHQPDVTFFKAKVLLDGTEADLRPGMSTRAEIKTAEAKSTLVVPVQSVVSRLPIGGEEGETGNGTAAANVDEEDELEVVFVVDGDSARQQPVETGLADATHVEILSGLEDGDQVVTGPHRVLKDLDHDEPVKIRRDDEEEEDD